MERLLTLMLCLFTLYFSSAQSCPVPVPAASPCPTVHPPPTDGQVILSGDTYAFTGTSVFNTLAFEGGTLYVCGDLTLDAIDFRGANIIVQAGATLTINDNNIRMDGDVNILNYGTLNLNGNTSMQGAGNSLINATSGYMTMPAHLRLEINSRNSSFTNLGLADMGELHLHSNNGGVCLGDGSELNLSLLMNNGLGSINGPHPGSACVSVQDETLINRPLTEDSSVHVCLASGIQETGGSGYGAAQVAQNCSGCGTLLSTSPIRLMLRRVSEVAEVQVYLEELPPSFEQSPNRQLYLYKSDDAYSWQKVDSAGGAAVQSFEQYWFDYGLQLERSKSIYFLAALGRSGREPVFYSDVVHLSLAQQKALKIMRHSNRLIELRLLADVQITSVQLLNYMGQVELERVVHDQQVRIDGQALAKGMHIIRLQLSDGSVLTRRVVF